MAACWVGKDGGRGRCDSDGAGGEGAGAAGLYQGEIRKLPDSDCLSSAKHEIECGRAYAYGRRNSEVGWEGFDCREARREGQATARTDRQDEGSVRKRGRRLVRGAPRL